MSNDGAGGQRNWEDAIAINPRQSGQRMTLPPVASVYSPSRELPGLVHEMIDVKEALRRDAFALPRTEDREGYHGSDHYGYWLSGLEDSCKVFDLTRRERSQCRRTLDLGCSSGRVIRHLGLQFDIHEVIGADINSDSVAWVNSELPKPIMAFQNYSIPSLPIEDNSVDLVTAFSVFSHIDSFVLTWLFEVRRILRPGGLAWITIHSDQTWQGLNESWPVWSSVVNHPSFVHADLGQPMREDFKVFRWSGMASYSSQVFYHRDYIETHWSRALDIIEIRVGAHWYQDAVIMRKS